MKEIERILREKKLEFEQIEAPAEMEMRLNNALKNKIQKRKTKNNWKTKTAAAIIILFIVSYNFDTLAFYTKKLIGYEQIMSGTLSQLNELGKGQVLGKSYTFKNGVSLTLDGIMLDDNNLLVFYTLKDPRKKLENTNISISIKGLINEYSEKSGYGKINEEKTEIKFISTFGKPFFLEKKLSFNFSLTENEKREEGKISFTLDKNKAMNHILKKSIGKSIDVDETKIRFKSILASPTTTVLKGYMQNMIELAKDHVSKERFRPNNLEIELISNGKKVQTQGSSMSTNLNGMTFEFRYDALPTELEKLQIKLVSFSADHDVNQRVELNENSINQSINILGQKIEIKDIYESKGNTYITICTEKGTVLTRVYLIMDGKSIGLTKTISDDHIKMKDGTILHTRTLCFPGTGSDLILDIQRLAYEKIYNKTIDIDVN